MEAGPPHPEHVASKAEELIEALSDQDIDHRVTANLEEIVQRFSGTRVHQHLPQSNCCFSQQLRASFRHLVLHLARCLNIGASRTDFPLDF